jgi:hypothetical protein
MARLARVVGLSDATAQFEATIDEIEARLSRTLLICVLPIYIMVGAMVLTIAALVVARG